MPKISIPNAALKKIADNPRLLTQVEEQTHRIGCPYCQVGYIFVKVEKHGAGKFQEVKVRDIHEPHKCEVCGKWARIGMQMKITAKQMPEEANKNGG